MSSPISQLPLSASWRSEPLSATERAKVRDILEACRDHHLIALRDLATSEGGLVEDEIRRTACTQAIDQADDGSAFAKWCAGPVLLGSDSTQGGPVPVVESLEKHRDEDQVQLDVNRSFVYYPEGTGGSMCAPK